MRKTLLGASSSTFAGRSLGTLSLLAVALASAAPARGQSCYVPSAPQYYSNMCATETFGQTYEFEQPLLSFFTSQNATPYLLACTNSDVSDLQRRQPRHAVEPAGDPPHPLGLGHDRACGLARTDVPAHLRRCDARRRRLSLRPGLPGQLRLGLSQAQRQRLEVPRQRVQARQRAGEILRQRRDVPGQRQRVRRGAGARQHQHREPGLLGADLQDRRRGHHPGDDLVRHDGPGCHRADRTRRRRLRQHAVLARARPQVLRAHRRLGASPAAGEEGFDRGGGGQHRQPVRPAAGGAEPGGGPRRREVGGGCVPPRHLGRQPPGQTVVNGYVVDTAGLPSRQLVHAPGRRTPTSTTTPPTGRRSRC